MSATRYHDADLDMMDNSIRNAKVEGYYSKTEVDELIGGLSRLEIKVVDSLPATGEFGYIYLVPAASSKTKNVKDEYIWIGNDWELIGSTQFKLDIVQDESGISINNVGLQNASEIQSGLMTKEMVGEFRAKQDALQPGANIVIENGIISATGGGSGGHSSCVRTFGGDGLTEYRVVHNLNTFNVLFQMRTVSPPIQFVQSTVYADDENTLRILFTEPLNSVMSISILACDMIIGPEPEPEPVLDVDEKSFSTATSVWTYVNNTGEPVYCQLFDSDGNEIRGDMIQNSEDDFSTVSAALIGEHAGTMLVAGASIVLPFNDLTSVAVDVVQEGYLASDRFLVQVYVDGTGRSMADIIQDSGAGVISIDLGDEPMSGYVVARKATMVQAFEDATEIVIQHDLGRVVGVQVFLDGTGQTMTDIVCMDENTVVVSSNNPITGYITIL